MYIVSEKEGVLDIVKVHTVEQVGKGANSNPYQVILTYNGHKTLTLRQVYYLEEVNHAITHFTEAYHSGQQFYYLDQNAKALYEKAKR